MTNTYRIYHKCPRCGQDLSFDKLKNRSAIHEQKMYVLARHWKSPDCREKATSNEAK